MKLYYIFNDFLLNSFLAPLEWIRNQIASNTNPRDILNKLVPELTIVSTNYFVIFSSSSLSCVLNNVWFCFCLILLLKIWILAWTCGWYIIMATCFGDPFWTCTSTASWRCLFYWTCQTFAPNMQKDCCFDWRRGKNYDVDKCVNIIVYIFYTCDSINCAQWIFSINYIYESIDLEMSKTIRI